MAAVLARSDVAPHVILEYNPHQSGNQRVDVILAGESSNGKPTFVVMELKQWAGCEWNAEDGRVRNTGASYEGPEGLEDPYEQAKRYVQFIRNFSEGMHDAATVAIHPVAFLHNASTDSAQTLLSADWETGRRIFVGDYESQEQLISELKDWFAADGDHLRVARLLLEARYHQGPGLLEVAGDLLTDRGRYPLTDEQHDVFAKIQNRIQQALSPSAERATAVIAVKGGPGTGKTWIAMHLVGANARAGRQVSYATNSTSLRAALQKRARVASRDLGLPVDALVTSARTYHAEETWAAPRDVMIVDEAHRITTYTVISGHANPAPRRQHIEANNITQLFELKKSSRVTVLLIDEDQSITPADDCRIDDLRDIAERTGSSFDMYELTEQHRSGGSDAYEAWVDALLAGQPVVWRDEADYRVGLAQSPQELEDFAHGGQLNEDDGRLLAGFCWEWKQWPKSPAPSSIADVPYDIELGDWKKHWNLRNKIDGFPKHEDWAYNTAGRQQVGSVFTAQGFEFARCGVIIGPDFRWDAARGEWVVDPSKTKYGKLVAAHRNDPDMADLIRNHYRVLLTRAMEGTFIYSTDAATQQKLAEIINP